MYDNVYIIF